MKKNHKILLGVAAAAIIGGLIYNRYRKSQVVMAPAIPAPEFLTRTAADIDFVQGQKKIEAVVPTETMSANSPYFNNFFEAVKA